MKLRTLFACCAFFIFSGICWADPAGPTDPAWTHGTLENGIRYFIRPNGKPENRQELRLVVDAGSVLEDEDQRGLAHYLEHMAFNGTTHFAKDEMVKYLESLGMAFGPDLNAYTSFDETVYKLRLPTDEAETVEKGYLVLSDWASEIIASDEELEAERGVIIEEWRGRRGGRARVRDQQYPVMFPESRYAERLPIGTLEVLENFEFDRLRDFYGEWYRPELMSVVAVGDLDVEETRRKIETYFADIEAPEEARERKEYTHPPHEETMVGVFSDPELNSSDVALMWKMPPMPVRNREAYLRSINASLITEMLNVRLSEKAQTSDAPFLSGGAYRGGYTRGGDVFMLYAEVEDGEGAYTRGAEVLLAEALRAARHGFTEAELARVQGRTLRELEKKVKERDTTESAVHAGEAVRHALTGEWMPGIVAELELHREWFPQVTPEKLQTLLDSWMTEENRVIMATGPSTEGETRLPSEEELRGVYDRVDPAGLEPYEEADLDRPLVAEAPEPGEVVEKEVREDLGLHVWTLSNGVRVILKPTDFKEDQILLNAWSPGGSNAYDDDRALQARVASQALSAMGLGAFSAVDLGKKLSDRMVSVSPVIGGAREGFSGGASPEDLETMLQLVYLHFQEPRRDAEAFEAMRNRLRAKVRNRLAEPRTRFRDMVSATLNLYHPRRLPMTPEEVDALDVEAVLEVIRDRFAHAGDFTFLLTGNLDPEAVEPMLAQWLGGLPAAGEDEEPTFLETGFPRHHTQRTMTAGVEPISEVHMVWFQDDVEYTYATRHEVSSLAGALRIRLREVLREEMGGTYHTSVVPDIQHRPTPRVALRIVFGCDPDRVDDLVEGVYGVVEEMKTETLEASYPQTVRETQRRRREVDMRENRFWDSVIEFYLWNDEDPGILLEFEEYVKKIDADYLRSAARRFFEVPDHAVFILKPEEDAAEEEAPPAESADG